MNPIIDKFLSECKEREEKAEKGPMLIERRDGISGDIDYVVYAPTSKDFCICYGRRAKFNAEMISHSRTDVPKLREALVVATEALELLLVDNKDYVGKDEAGDALQRIAGILGGGAG